MSELIGRMQGLIEALGEDAPEPLRGIDPESIRIAFRFPLVVLGVEDLLDSPRRRQTRGSRGTEAWIVGRKKEAENPSLIATAEESLDGEFLRFTVGESVAKITRLLALPEVEQKLFGRERGFEQRGLDGVPDAFIEGIVAVPELYVRAIAVGNEFFALSSAAGFEELKRLPEQEVFDRLEKAAREWSREPSNAPGR